MDEGSKTRLREPKLLVAVAAAMVMLVLVVTTACRGLLEWTITS